jgi:Ca-activated chloride channel family protein
MATHGEDHMPNRHPYIAASTLVLAGLLAASCAEKTVTEKKAEEPAPPPAPSKPEPIMEADALSNAPMPATAGRMKAAAAPAMAGFDGGAWMPPPENTEKYPGGKPNATKVAAQDPVSTFSIDVDTAAYGVVRRYLNQGSLPPRDAVRVEEMVNYFDYTYQLPPNREQPFATTVQVYPAPWNKDTLLMHIGIKGYDLPSTERPAANLVFLVDVSGSMDEPDKLPLVKKSLRLLVNELKPEDRVALVVYAGNAGTVLEPTSGKDKAKILAALDKLEAGGSTAGGEGIRQAYALAQQSFAKDKVNRVILATDGDFNVGISDPKRLEDFVAKGRDTGIFLTCLGFGGGNYNDVTMQSLAQAGNGNAAFIDTLNEARKVLVDEMGSTLFPIAKDVKIQVEFNPQTVAEYRLIGYETRLLDRTDFNNDKVDAGDIGAGHAVTALYEVTPKGSPAQLSDPLRYGATTPAAKGTELAFLKIRYKLPEGTTSKLIERPIAMSERLARFADAPEDSRFAAAVAGVAQLLKGDAHMGRMTLADLRAIAQDSKGKDLFGYRAEFVSLVRSAETAPPLPPLEMSGGPGRMQ